MNLRYTSRRARKELFIPKLMERRSREIWLKEGGTSMINALKNKVQEILTNHMDYPLEPDIEKELNSIQKRVEERNIDEYDNR